MNFIKDAIDGKSDELTHKQFRRFGKGVFEKKAMLQVKKAKTGFAIKTTFEYLDGILLYVSSNFSGEAEISGTIQGAGDLEGRAARFGLKGQRKAAMGVKKFKLDSSKIKTGELRNLVNEFRDEFLLLSLKCGGFEMASKAGLPKPGKTEKEDDKGKIDFCKMTVSAEKGEGLVKELLFDVDNLNFKQAIARHTFMIDSFDIPKECANDPAKVRELALRKGKIKRVVEIDGNKTEKEYSFRA